MKISELIEVLTIAQRDLGDMPVHMTWTPEAKPGPVVAAKIYIDRMELRCQSADED